jgi:ribosomal protein S18 acetylase RimI-like enzyme
VTSEPAIRRASRADLEALVEGNRRMAMETESVQLDAGTLRSGVAALFDDPAKGAYWVVEHDGAVVAQTMVTHEWSDWRNGDVWWIQSVYVQPEYRRRGLFRHIYRHLRAEAQRLGVVGLRLYVDTSNTRAQAVYAALGMQGDHYRVFEDMFAEPRRNPPRP